MVKSDFTKPIPWLISEFRISCNRLLVLTVLVRIQVGQHPQKLYQTDVSEKKGKCLGKKTIALSIALAIFKVLNVHLEKSFTIKAPSIVVRLRVDVKHTVGGVFIL
jgi:hypothetical protein